MKEVVLLTGSKGFIGGHLIDKLHTEGYEIVEFDLKDRNDVRNYMELDKVFKKHSPSIVVHLAAKTGVRKSWTEITNYYYTNVLGTLNVLKASKENNVKTFVFASSSSVYGSTEKYPFNEEMPTFPISPYAATKVAGEQSCQSFSTMSDMQITCLRFFTVYGKNGRKDMSPYIFMNSIHYKLPFKVFGDGTQMRDFTYVGDIVNGIILAMTKKEETNFNIYNLGFGYPITLNEFISIMEKVIRKKARYENIEVAKGDMKTTFANISKAKKLLNYSPKIGVEEGLYKMYKWFEITR